MQVFVGKISDKAMFRTFLDGQPPVGSDIGRTLDRSFPKVAPLRYTYSESSSIDAVALSKRMSSHHASPFLVEYCSENTAVVA